MMKTGIGRLAVCCIVAIMLGFIPKAGAEIIVYSAKKAEPAAAKPMDGFTASTVYVFADDKAERIPYDDADEATVVVRKNIDGYPLTISFPTETIYNEYVKKPGRLELNFNNVQEVVARRMNEEGKFEVEEISIPIKEAIDTSVATVCGSTVVEAFLLLPQRQPPVPHPYENDLKAPPVIIEFPSIQPESELSIDGGCKGRHPCNGDCSYAIWPVPPLPYYFLCSGKCKRRFAFFCRCSDETCTPVTGVSQE